MFEGFRRYSAGTLQTPSGLELLHIEEAVEAEETPISVDAVFDALRRNGSTSFTVVSAAKKGNVWMARDFTTFRDVDRLARLFGRMQRRTETKDGRGRYECDPKKLMAALIDFEAKAGTWTYEDLDTWLTKPSAFVPGTKMTFAGITSPQERADVIAYLRSLSEKPAPLPAK